MSERENIDRLWIVEIDFRVGREGAIVTVEYGVEDLSEVAKIVENSPGPGAIYHMRLYPNPKRNVELRAYSVSYSLDGKTIL